MTESPSERTASSILPPAAPEDGGGEDAGGGRAARFFRRLIHERVPYGIDHLMAPLLRPSDTLVLSGYWRSGTTWLHESLARLMAAKTVFEPFHFLVPDVHEIFSDQGLSGRPAPFLELYMPFSGEPLRPPLHGVFKRALTADIPGRIVRLVRKGPAESLRRRVVVKFVRAHLCLRAAQKTFGMPVIHLYRDPRAVVGSIKRLNWSWLFEHLFLAEQLLEPADGRALYFDRWRAEILDYDRRDTISRIVAHWALTEMFLLDSYRTEPGARIAFLRYEDLCRAPERIPEILNGLMVPHRSRNDFRALDADSFSTSSSRRGASMSDRIGSWKEDLTSSEIARIEAIAEQFGFADRLRS